MLVLSAESDASEDLAVALLKGNASEVSGDATGYVLDTVFGAPDDTDEETRSSVCQRKAGILRGGLERRPVAIKEA